MMKQIDMRVPEPQAILQAWMPFKQTIGVTSVHNEGDYAQATATISVLLEEIGGDENHPLANVLDYLSGLRRRALFDSQSGKPHDVLRSMIDRVKVLRLRGYFTFKSGLPMILMLSWVGKCMTLYFDHNFF
jgi:hypothetical protein